jgi:Zn-dependent membrane protease YugP
MILILFLLTLAIGLLAQWHVKRAYARHSRTPVQSGYAGAEAAHEILRQAGITNVDVVVASSHRILKTPNTRL